MKFDRGRYHAPRQARDDRQEARDFQHHDMVGAHGAFSTFTDLFKISSVHRNIMRCIKIRKPKQKDRPKRMGGLECRKKALNAEEAPSLRGDHR